jgi:hypothetical protein
VGEAVVRLVDAMMVHLYAPRRGPGARLRAVLEGRGNGLVLTPAQECEREAIRASWDERVSRHERRAVGG